MVKSPQRIWIEANDECPYFYEAHELHDVEQDVVEYVRADLYTALEAKLAETQEKLIEANDKLTRQNEVHFRAGAVKVKPLEWHARPGVDGTFDAYTEIGHFILTITDDGRSTWVAVGLMQGNYCTSDIDTVKAAVQADYERRILAALEPAKPAPAAEPVAWVAADTLNSPHPGCVSSLAYVSQIDKDQGREYVPLYTHPTPSEARLREALDRCQARHALEAQEQRR